jgi:choline dehydrogenase-like flavoprotein
MPVFESRVEIDPQVKDFWGIPVLRIMAKRHPNDFIVGNFLAARASEIVQASGADDVFAKELQVPDRPVDSVPHGQHQAGTCRMGNDPKTSVTNRYGQLHEIDNVFCADASLHVTNAGLNPATTIMALGYWVSDYIKREWKGTKFRAS